MAESNCKRHCSLHPQRVIQAVCITHKKPLCLICFTNNQCVDPNCKKIEVDSDKGEAILELLDACDLVKDASVKQQDLLKDSKHIEAVFVNEVNTFHDKLQAQLHNSRDAIIQEFKNQLTSASCRYEIDKKSTLEYHGQLNGWIESFKQDKVIDIQSVKQDINQIRLAITAMTRKELPEWKFVKSPSYERLMIEKIGSIGPKTTDDETGSGSTTIEDDTLATSEEVSEDAVATHGNVSGRPGHGDYDDVEVSRTLSDKAIAKVDMPPVVQKRKPKFNAPHDMKVSEGAVARHGNVSKEYDPYVDVEMSRTLSVKAIAKEDMPPVARKRQTKFNAPHDMKVTTQHESPRQSPCSFSQVKIFDNKLLLLDSAHAVVIISTQYGTTVAEKSMSYPVSYIAVVDETSFAVLSENPLAITLLEEQDGRIRVRRKDKIKENVEGVVGFDFDTTENKFAVISQDTLCLCSLDDAKRGTNGDYMPDTIKLASIIRRCQSTVEPNHSSVRGVYLFQSRALVFLNTHQQTMKMFDLNRHTISWKKSLRDESSKLTDMTADGEAIFVSSQMYIVHFSMDGSAIAKYVIDDRIHGARSLCVSGTDNVIVVTSMSDQVYESKNVFFIAK